MTIVIFKNIGGPKGIVMEFDSEYLREKTLPKRVINVTTKYDYRKRKSKN